MNGVRIVVVRDPSPERVRECVAALSPEERQTFSRMKNPREADVRAVLRAEANRLRDSGAVVSVSHAGDFGVLARRGDACDARVRVGILPRVHSPGIVRHPNSGDRPEPSVPTSSRASQATPRRHAIGIDCEPWAGETPDDSFVGEIASDQEFAAWRVLPESEKRRAFVRLWTLKEAGFKAGIAAAMREVPVASNFSRIVAPGYVSRFESVSPEYAVAVVWRAVGGDPE